MQCQRSRQNHKVIVFFHGYCFILPPWDASDLEIFPDFLRSAFSNIFVIASRSDWRGRGDRSADPADDQERGPDGRSDGDHAAQDVQQAQGPQRREGRRHAVLVRRGHAPPLLVARGVYPPLVLDPRPALGALRRGFGLVHELAVLARDDRDEEIQRRGVVLGNPEDHVLPRGPLLGPCRRKAVVTGKDQRAAFVVLHALDERGAIQSVFTLVEFDVGALGRGHRIGARM